MTKKNDKDSLFCSFCGKNQKEVKKLIAGPTVFVCDECVKLCMDIIKEDTKNNKIKIKQSVPKPREIYSILNDYVIGQNSAKKILSVAVYDTMQYISSKIMTICIGQAASASSLLLAAGEKDMRFSLPNSRIMIHQPSGGYQGQVTDLEIQTNEIIKTKKRLNQIYAKHTGKNIKEVELIMERDKYFSPEEAIKFGLIDKIVKNRK